MTLEPIAYFKSPFTSKFGIPRQSGLVPELRGEISRMFRVGELISSGEVMVTSMRHKEALLSAKKALLLVQDSINSGMSEDFFSIDLMAAYSELGKIIGEQVEDDLVEEIFARFCLGK